MYVNPKAVFLTLGVGLVVGGLAGVAAGAIAAGIVAIALSLL